MKYSFSRLNLDDKLISSLAKIGMVNPSPVQYNFIESSIDETSIIFQSKSGTGKTVSYCISLINKIIQRKNSEILHDNIDSLNTSQFNNYSESSFGDVVIIVPTRELSYQIYFFFLSLSHYIDLIKPILLVGSSNVLKILNYMKKNNVNVVISTPGRIKTILRSKPSKTDIAKYGLKSNHLFFKTHLLIFDEADMLLDDHFFEQTKFICSKLCNPFVQVVAVSATFLKPQFKAFEDMVYEMDKIYKDRFINNLNNNNSDDGNDDINSNTNDHNIKNNNTDKNNINNKDNEKEKQQIQNYNIDTNTNNISNKNNNINNQDKVFVEPRLNYYVNHLLLSRRIKNIDRLSKYVYSFKRKFLKIILSTSYLSRVLDFKSLEFGQESYYITSETTQTIDTETIGETNVNGSTIGNGNTSLICNNHNIKNNYTDKNNNNINKYNHNGSITLVLDKVDFYVAIVRDAPNIVMQIGLKIEVVVKVLSCINYNKCIIFCNQSHTRIQTYKLLQSLGYSCYINSSRVSPAERVKTLYDLNTIDKVVILCTDLMSRGIGFSNVDLVINMDIPGSKEVFLHRSGRSGRFGSTGVCVTICMESEIETYEYFLYSLNFKSLPVENIYNTKTINNNNDDMNSNTNNHNIENNNTDKNNSNYYEFDLSNILKRSVRPKKISEINVDVSSLIKTKCDKQEYGLIDSVKINELEGIKDNKENNNINSNEHNIENNNNNTDKNKNNNKGKQEIKDYNIDNKGTKNTKIIKDNNTSTDIDFEIDAEELIKGFMKQRISFCESVEI